MSTTDSITRKHRPQRWVAPLLSVLIGVAYFVSGWVGGDHGFAVFGLVLMVGVAVLLLLLSRFSETVAGLLDRRDERINAIDMQATTVAGGALVVAVIVGFIVEIAHGRNGSPYSMLGAIAGVTYLVALVILRLRR